MFENIKKKERSNSVDYYNKYKFYTKKKKSNYYP